MTDLGTLGLRQAGSAVLLEPASASEPEVIRYKNALNNSVHKTIDLLDQLDERLSIVLIPEEQQPNKEVVEPTPVIRTVLANEIASSIRVIDAANNRITLILEQLAI